MNSVDTCAWVRPPSGKRRDLYWILYTDRGHCVLYRAASAVGRAMTSGEPPLPGGWHLCLDYEYGDGERVGPVAKTLRVQSDYDSDPSLSPAQRADVESFVAWIKGAVKRPTDGR